MHENMKLEEKILYLRKMLENGRHPIRQILNEKELEGVDAYIRKTIRHCETLFLYHKELKSKFGFFDKNLIKIILNESLHQESKELIATSPGL
jgi:hypothetical protein